MSRVFVSCAYRDRAVGAELGSIVRSLGHEPADDQDEERGTLWWNEVVGRIEASDVFVAVATPAYTEAYTCRLAAKHAEAKGLPVVRIDLGGEPVPDCPPVVTQAVGVPFAPEDPEAVARLAHALIGSPPDAPQGATAAAGRASAPEPELKDASDPPEPDRPPSQVSGAEVGVAVATLLSAAGLLYVGLSIFGSPEPSTDAPPEGTATTGLAASGTPTPGSGESTADPAVAGVLAGVNVVGSPRLPASSCRAGADAVTCTNPAPNISTVVLTPYQTPADLYGAYTAEVESLSGGPITENTGNCSNAESEGEVGWNLDLGHTLDYSIAQQESGGLDPASESAGRVFCTDDEQVMQLVWTQDPGLLVRVTGQPSELVIPWWSDVHLALGCASHGVGSGCTP